MREREGRRGKSEGGREMERKREGGRGRGKERVGERKREKVGEGKSMAIRYIAK